MRERQKVNMNQDGIARQVSYTVHKHIGVLKSGQNGWNRELNIVSWNDAEPKLDIRDWNEDHSKMSRGINLKLEEFKVLMTLGEEFISSAPESKLDSFAGQEVFSRK